MVTRFQPRQFGFSPEEDPRVGAMGRLTRKQEPTGAMPTFSQAPQGALAPALQRAQTNKPQDVSVPYRRGMEPEVDDFQGRPDVMSTPVTAGEDTEQTQDTKAKSDKDANLIAKNAAYEKPSWYRPAKGLFQGLRAFGQALLTSGGDEGQAWAAGLHAAFGPLEEELVAKKAKAQLDSDVRAMLHDGKYTPQSIQNYRDSGGDASYLKPATSLEQQMKIRGLKKKTQTKDEEEKQEATQEVRKYDDHINLIDSILQNPNLEDVTGRIDALTPTVFQGSADLEVKMSQLEAIQNLANAAQMKGQGSMSDGERALVAAASGLDPRQSTESYRQQLQRIKAALQQMKRERQKQVGLTEQQTRVTPATTGGKDFSNLYM